MPDLLQIGMEFILLLPAIVFHEAAHGYVANLLGDPTARMRGRLTLNPIPHIDPFGTILLPLLLLFTTGGFIGYAKPVPINPYNFQDRRMGMLLTGIAGPATNLALAAVAGLIVRFVPLPISGFLGEFRGIADFLIFFSYANLVLMFFNLIPIPPLDGSRVVARFLSGRAEQAYENLERYGFLILLALLYLAPQLFGQYLRFTAAPLFSLFTGLG